MLHHQLRGRSRCPWTRIAEAIVNALENHVRLAVAIDVPVTSLARRKRPAVLHYQLRGEAVAVDKDNQKRVSTPWKIMSAFAIALTSA